MCYKTCHAKSYIQHSTVHMSKELSQIIYISSAKAELTEDALLKLLAGSQKRNASRGITGILLHSEGNIIQVIEGPLEAAEALYTKIAMDSRHGGVTLISRKSVEQRDFPEFKMGFKRAKRCDFKEQLPGFTDVVEQRSVSQEQLKGLSLMVATFIRTFAKITNIEKPESILPPGEV